jgi:DnaJ-class molecular chaperone
MDMRKKEAFEILGLPENSDDDTIKKAYRKLALKNHPDKGGDPEEFKKISNAYNVIINGEDEPDINPMDIFEQLFNGGMHGMPFGMMFGQGMHGMPMNFSMINTTRHELPLEAFYTGKKLQINGKIVELSPNTPIGSKIVIKDKNQQFHIQFVPKKHPDFDLDNRQNLVYKYSISLFEALLGFQLHLKLPNGKKMFFKSPQNRVIVNNKVFSIPNMGCPIGNGKKSNLIIVCDILMPMHLTELEKHREQLQEILEFNIPMLSPRDDEEIIQL